MTTSPIRSGPAMIIAAAALVIALAGTAVAGPDAITRAVTTSKVKKIAKKQANKVYSQRTDLVRVNGPTVSVEPGGSTGLQADCPDGYLVVGTGFHGQFGDMWRVESYTYFVGGFGTNDASIAADFSVQAICAKSDQTSYSRASTATIESRAEAVDEYEQDRRADLKAWRASGN